MVGGLDDWRQFDQIECNQTFHTVAQYVEWETGHKWLQTPNTAKMTNGDVG